MVSMCFASNLHDVSFGIHISLIHWIMLMKVSVMSGVVSDNKSNF